MAASFNESQKLDYLWKKIGYGVAKTSIPPPGSGSKEAFNESIASPLLYRGDLVWKDSGSIPSNPPSDTTSLVQVYKDGGGAGYSPTVQCTEDLTAPDNQTWKTNLTNWIPTQFGDNYLVLVYVDTTGSTTPQTTGTRLFQAGSGSDDTWFFDYQAGILNFNGATIPSVITGGVTGKSVFIVGYRYVGTFGVGGDTGNITFSNTTISTSFANGNITLAATGTGLVQISGTTGFIVPAGNTDQRPSPAVTATVRFNTTNTALEVWDGTNWVSGTGDISIISNQTLNGDGSTTVFSLNQPATAESILVSINGILQTPGVDYTTSQSPDQITFTTAPAAGDVIQVRFISTTSTVSALYNGTSSINIPVSSGNAIISVGGTSNVLTVTSTGIVVAGTLGLSGNIATANVTGNVTANTFIGSLFTNSIVNSGSNGTGNIGSASTTFNTIFAKATSAQYADLAEFYSADAVYEPGTVLSFGGDREVTLTTQDADPCVAGVVSTNPSYIMNASIFAEFPTQVALTGRVPCRVIGSVTKGAMMISAGNGAARAERTPAMGTVIGKALEAFDGDVGTIEIVVGRL